ncbi:hypothetical protein FRB94_009468 [Tulasnella sp. JGI-2019a]|nr:hypothetical protein FRB94_009468 [Tulasnella sp. JGI-2019a]
MSLPMPEQVKIPVQDDRGGFAPAILHIQQGDQLAKDGAVVLVSGAGGGVSGPAAPAGIYPSLAEKLATLAGVPTLRLDYRQAAGNNYCTADLLASLNYLAERLGSRRFIVVGWSFGGAPCFTAADQDSRIVGVAAIASQTDGTSGIRRLAPRPVLLMHGTKDQILSDSCSKHLFKMYGNESGERTLRLFKGDDHSLTMNAIEVERLLYDFVQKVLGMELGGGDTIGSMNQGMLGSGQESIEAVKVGGNLKNGEAP